MLIDEIVQYCDQAYTTQPCARCIHPSKCSGGCKMCLEEVHYPARNPDGMKDYDCSKMIDFYVCDYSYKYASEIWYLLNRAQKFDAIDKLNVMSIGCGGCPDLMALESYLTGKNERKPISYIGIDVNELWKPIHTEISNYCKRQNNMIAQFGYVDAIEYYNDNILGATNVLILQYVISHFYNTGQIPKIKRFFNDLVANIILHKEKNKPLIVLVNDVNSCYRGRDYFLDLVRALGGKGLEGTYNQFYFDYNIQNQHQRYGNKHDSINILYQVPYAIYKYEPWQYCSSAQLLIEIN